MSKALIRTSNELPPGWRLVTEAYHVKQDAALKASALGFVRARQAKPEDVMIIRLSETRNYVALRGLKPKPVVSEDNRQKHPRFNDAIRKYGLKEEFKALARQYRGESEIRAWAGAHPLLSQCAIPRSLRWTRILFGVPTGQGGHREKKKH